MKLNKIVIEVYAEDIESALEKVSQYNPKPYIEKKVTAPYLIRHLKPGATLIAEGAINFGNIANKQDDGISVSQKKGYIFIPQRGKEPTLQEVTICTIIENEN